MKQVLATGVIRSPHGVKGYVKVHPFSDDFEHFFRLKEVTLQRGDKTRTEVIESVQAHSGELLVKFRGIDSPAGAEEFGGSLFALFQNSPCRVQRLRTVDFGNV